VARDFLVFHNKVFGELKELYQLVVSCEHVHVLISTICV
jgi:hypothetical protein